MIENKKGFAGLINLVSDISMVESINGGELKNFSSDSSSLPYENVNSKDDSKQKRFNPRSLVWIGLAVICMIYFANSGQSTRRPPARPVSVPPRNSPPVAANRTRNTNFNFNTQLPSVTANTTPNTNFTAQLQYDKPPIGTNNILNISQLRWYFRENIRLNTMRDRITTDHAVDAFNKLVDDYNSRCGSFRYQTSEFERARLEVESNSIQIIADAIREVTAWNNIPDRPTLPLPYFANDTVDYSTPQIPDSPKPTRPDFLSDTVDYSTPQYIKEVQQLLKDNGYNPGPIDGAYGNRTKNAIKDFQRDAGLIQDGKIDKSLLDILRIM